MQFVQETCPLFYAVHTLMRIIKLIDTNIPTFFVLQNYDGTICELGKADMLGEKVGKLQGKSL